ncbi:hypothetical protein ES332_A08G084400v1 [Gossypium tomentosum]|uniref:Uncharacterized protein n=1 Tax=Gossypium tomentosum TaxID=34277 RepID=A0A5D2PC96_GOSTO|nr:hypothetical protein ES332_A08G084400v1 [Gossypium tomentosum]
MQIQMEKAKKKLRSLSDNCVTFPAAQGKLRTILCGRSKTNKGITRPVITLRSHRSCSRSECGCSSHW